MEKEQVVKLELDYLPLSSNGEGVTSLTEVRLLSLSLD